MPGEQEVLRERQLLVLYLMLGTYCEEPGWIGCSFGHFERLSHDDVWTCEEVLEQPSGENQPPDLWSLTVKGSDVVERELGVTLGTSLKSNRSGGDWAVD